MEAATALVVRLVHSESVSSDFQGHAIKSIRTSANSSLLESLARDPTLKRWLRVLAVRLLAESQRDAATSLSCDEDLDVEVRLEAVNHLGRTSYADALWSLACDCATNARVRRFAVWWLGHLSDDETDTRLQGLAETKPEARVLAAIEDARTLLAVRAAASAV